MKIEKLTEDIFKVTVSGGVKTQHEVTVIDIARYDLTKRRTTKKAPRFFIQIPFRSGDHHINSL